VGGGVGEANLGHGNGVDGVLDGGELLLHVVEPRRRRGREQRPHETRPWCSTHAQVRNATHTHTRTHTCRVCTGGSSVERAEARGGRQRRRRDDREDGGALPHVAQVPAHPLALHLSAALGPAQLPCNPPKADFRLRWRWTWVEVKVADELYRWRGRGWRRCRR
jgi:hypothetical protein